MGEVGLSHVRSEGGGGAGREVGLSRGHRARSDPPPSPPNSPRYQGKETTTDEYMRLTKNESATFNELRGGKLIYYRPPPREGPGGEGPNPPAREHLRERDSLRDELACSIVSAGAWGGKGGGGAWGTPTTVDGCHGA